MSLDVLWIERVKEQAEAEGVSQAEIVDRAFRTFFVGGEGHGSGASAIVPPRDG